MATAAGLSLGRARAVERGRWHAAAWRSATALQLALGLGLLAGNVAFVFGAAWDIQWHVAVGRDRPLTPPHLLLLSGIAITGVLAMAGVLGFSWDAGRSRAARVDLPAGGNASPPGGQGVRLWLFHAPIGLYVAGFGALLSATAFPLDDYWHRLYGVDVTLWSAFHVMIIAGMALAAMGTAYTFAPNSGVGVALGLAAVAAVLLLFQAQALDQDGIIAVRPRPVIVFPALLVSVTMPWLVAAAPAVRFPGGATLMAVGLVAIRQGLLWFVPWAVRAGAAAEGLPFRSSAPPFAVTPTAFPVWIVLAGLVVDLSWFLLRRARLRWLLVQRLTVPLLLLAGTAAGSVEGTLDRPWMRTLPLTRLGRGLNMQDAMVNALPSVLIASAIAAAIGIGLGAALRRGRA